MNPAPSYEEQWKDYRRRRRWFWIAFLGYLPGVPLIGMPLGYLFSSEKAVMVVAIAWMAAIAITSYRAGAWRCPRCGETYFAKPWISNPLARRCLHCKLPKYSCDPAA